MKINLCKISSCHHLASLAILAASASSCKLPKAESYAKSEWAVHTIPTNDVRPLSFKVEDIHELPISGDDDPLFDGPAPTVAHVPGNATNASDPLSNVQEPGKPISDTLINVDTIPDNTAAITLTTKGTPRPQPTMPPNPLLLPIPHAVADTNTLPHESAQLPSAENVAQLVETSRPPMPPRGIPNATNLRAQSTASNAVNQASPPSEELAEILQLARKVEAIDKN